MEKEYNDAKFYRIVTSTIIAMSLAIAGLLYPYVISGRLLKRRFKQLGDASGKTLEEIVTVVGDADAICRIGNDVVALSWTMPTHKVELEFSDGTCMGSHTAKTMSKVDGHASRWRSTAAILFCVILIVAVGDAIRRWITNDPGLYDSLLRVAFGAIIALLSFWRTNTTKTEV